MRREDAVLWIFALLLLAAVAATVLLAPRRSRHGYGAAEDQGTGTYAALT